MRPTLWDVFDGFLVGVLALLIVLMLGACTHEAPPPAAVVVQAPPPAVTPADPPDASPTAARRYRADLLRAARLAWGLDAPVATMAAQVHQESAWRPDAVSHVGAAGLAQFMPATSRWWCERQKMADCSPHNPAWALRALAGYDRYLYDRLGAAGAECNRWWATLRAYNGGIGHWQAEARLVSDPSNRASVDRQCGAASRSRKHCAENLGYPDRIIHRHQAIYAIWGRGVCG